MTLFWGNKSGLVPARRKGARVRRPPTCLPRVMIEQLEYRVLLDAGALAVITPNMPAVTAEVSPFESGSYGPAPIYGSSILDIATEGGLRERPVDVVMPTMLLLTSRSTPSAEAVPLDDVLAPRDPNETSANVGVFTQEMSGPSLPSSALYVEPSSSQLALTSEDQTASFADGRVSGVGGAGISGTGIADIAQAYTTSATESAATWDSDAAARHLDLPGILGPDQTSMTYEIALDSAPQILGMSLHAASNGGEMPVLGNVELMSPAGVPLAELGPQPGGSAIPPQSMMLYLKNAPAGGHLDIQVLAAASSAESSDSSTATTASSVATAPLVGSANWNVSFVLDVQKQDSSSLPQDAGGSVLPSFGAIGTLVVATPIQSGAFSTSASAATTEVPEESAVTEALPTSTRVIDASTATAETDAESTPTDGIGFTRIATGPLASRSAGPLGPTLASIDADPTQAVDRHERALSQEIDGLAAADLPQSGSARSGVPDDDETHAGVSGSAVFDSRSNLESVVTVSSRGGFPLKVTAQGHGRRGGLTELWATLDAEPNGPTIGSQETVWGPMVLSGEGPLTTSDVAAGPDPMACPDYVKAACGLALGLGLTSGPLFPELIASRTRRLPNWMATVLGRSNPPGASASAPSHASRGRSWARRFFGPR